MDKPEFSTAEIDRLQVAYQQAVYEVDCNTERIELHIGRHSSRLQQLLDKHKFDTWALITAFNPYSQCLSASANLLRHQNLIEYLQPLPFKTFDAWGKDEAGSWTPEKSVLIMGISRIQAREIGRKLQQNAIVYGEAKKPPELLWLD